MTLSVVAGRDIIKTEREEILDTLRDLVARVESGDLTANRVLVALMDSEVDSFSMHVLYRGRAVEMLGYVTLIEDSIRSDIYQHP